MNKSESISAAIFSVQPEDLGQGTNNTYPVRVLAAAQCTKEQLQNAVSSYAFGCAAEEVAVLVDVSLSATGEKGCLFTAERFYSDDSEFLDGRLNPNVPMPIRYADLDRVALDENHTSHIILYYKDGGMIRTYTGIYTRFYAAVFGAILREVRPEEVAEELEEVEPEEVTEEPEAETEPEEITEEPEAETEPEEITEEPEAETEPEEITEEPGAETEPPVSDASVSEETKMAYQRGIERYNAGDADTALKEFMKAAEAGHMDAQYKCGMMYDYGWGTVPDKSEALKWYLKAAEMGHEDAPYICGLIYYDGEGTTQDYVQAKYWFEKAAAQGNEDAKIWLEINDLANS